MTSHATGRSLADQLTSFGGALFDGYPYLVTRIGQSALRHIALAPASWPRDRLVDLARRQRDANRLDTCLVLGCHDALYLHAEGREGRAEHVPSGMPVIDRLRLAEALPATAELSHRRAHLAVFVETHQGKGYIVGDGLEGGRPAGPQDIERLAVAAPDAVPPGLRRCATCGRFAGDYLAVKAEGNGDPSPRVIEVLCRCSNHNHCAACDEPLASDRLSAYSYDEEERKAWYLAAYAAFSHRCAVT